MRNLDRRSLLVGGGALLAAGGAEAGDDGVVRIPVAVRRNQPLVALELDGHGPFTFLIDTGASGFGVTAEVARRAGLAMAGRRLIAGVNGGVVSVPAWFARDVRVGGAAELGVTTFAESPVAGLDGYLAGNALIAQPAAFAFADGEVRLYRRGRPDVSGYTRLQAAFDVGGRALTATRAALDPHVVVTASLAGRSVRLAVDTGAEGAVVLLPDASRRLWDTTPALDVVVAGATGLSRGRLVRVGPLRLGGLDVPRVVATLDDPDARHEDDRVDGLIGMDLLRQLELVVDAGAGAVWIKPSAAFGQAFRYDRSGLTLRAVERGLEVAAVAPGSPAATAGLARGDVLTPARAMSREAFRWSLSDAPGVVVELDAGRAGAVRPVRLVLKELI